MLLNEFLKEHKKVAEDQRSIIELKEELQAVTRQLRDQAVQIQKMSSQVEIIKPAAQVVLNNP